MCGILALIAEEGRPSETDLLLGLEAMRSRGPDSFGWKRSTCGQALIGHRRLATNDIGNGAQPLANEDGQLVVAVNGEFYGHRSIRADLVRRGHTFRSEADSEILPHLYEEGGRSALDQLRGEFAFILWDQRTESLFAARDRFGIKPLLYGRHNGVLYIASNAKAMFAARFPKRWDEESLFQAMSYQYPVPGRTLYQGISVVPPGHYLEWKGGSLRISRYWDMDYPEELGEKTAGSVETFRDLLTDAIRARLDADVPIAFQVSGGIDSSSVAALASREMGSSIPCFTVGFESEDHDERELASDVVASIGGEHHVVHVGTKEIADLFPEAVLAGEGLCINAHLMAKYRLCQAIRASGYKVALTGEGADETLLGYAHFRQDLCGNAGDLVSTNQASLGIMLPDGNQLQMDEVRAKLGHLPTWIAAKASLGWRIRQVLSEDWLGSLRHMNPVAQFADWMDTRQLSGRSRPLQSSYLWAKTALEGYILRTLGDGMEMAHGVEGRLPFLDSRLFEWLRNADLRLKIHEGQEKWILREAMRGIIPERIRTREKHPFLAPPQFGAGRPLSTMLLDLLHSSSMKDLPFFNREAIYSLISDSGRVSAVMDPVLFLVASVCVLDGSLELRGAA